jgi:formylglycine-generating enzyme required for sulfatase activity
MRRKGRRIAFATIAVAIVVVGLAVYLGWPHLVFWYRFAPLGLNAQGFPEYRHRQMGIVFVRLPGGKFWMGAQRTDPKGRNFDPDAQDNEGPVHEVTLSPFLIGKYEVTQAQWTKVIGLNPSRFKGDDNRPVEMMSWEGIKEFSRKTHLTLPTEAQWEFACRGATTTPIAGTGKIDEIGWYDVNGKNTTHPVGQKAPNGFGVLDMHGNVWEWCEDNWDEVFYGKPEARRLDPVSISESGVWVVRGGSWANSAWACRSSIRGQIDLTKIVENNHVGIRLACPVP